jgi:hypothetical protein
MSTRGAIARPDGDGFKGVYHHWDSYPSGLGNTLFKLARVQYRGDEEAMLKALIDDHPAGWSDLNGCNVERPEGSFGPISGGECYCHGRNDPAQEINEKNASACGVEYVYVIDIQTGNMTILSSYNPSGSKMIGMFGSGNPDATWKPIAVVNLTGAPEPDWDLIESH